MMFIFVITRVLTVFKPMPMSFLPTVFKPCPFDQKLWRINGHGVGTEADGCVPIGYDYCVLVYMIYIY